MQGPLPAFSMTKDLLSANYVIAIHTSLERLEYLIGLSTVLKSSVST